MNNQRYITSNAMLAAYLGKKSTDCFDLMKPFILYLLPPLGERVDMIEISEGIKNQFGFNNVPENVINKIVRRISKQSKYIEKKDGDYYVIAEYDKSSFEKKQRTIATKVDNLSVELAKYIKNKHFNPKVTKEQATGYIQTFLESYNYIYNEIEKYKCITATTSGKSNFWVARFIVDSYEKNSSLFDDFLEIVKGSLASRAILFFANELTEERKSLQNTAFYFDTRLLINCLGLSSDREHKATTELKELIEKSGGTVCTFDRYVEELHGILTKYIKSPADRMGLSLDYFRKAKLPIEYIKTYRDSLDSHLKDNNILVEENPDCDKPIGDLDWPIDPLELKKTLSQYVNYNSNKDETTLNNDAQTLENISVLRYKLKGKTTLENCKAIFVTQNTDLTYAAHQYFKNKCNVKGIELAVSEVDLTSSLWMKYENNSNNLPEMRLLENAYTACCPTNEVVDAFRRIANDMGEKGHYTQEQVEMIRQGNVDLSTLVDKISNDSEDLSEECVKEFCDEYLSSVEKKVKKSLQKEYSKLGRERKEFYHEHHEKTAQLEKKENDLDTKEKYLADYEAEQRRKTSNYKNDVKQRLINKADDDAKNVQRIVQIVGNIFVGLFSLLLLVLSFVGFIDSFENERVTIRIATLIFTGIGFLGVIDVICGIKRGGGYVVSRIAAIAYSRKYEKSLEELKKYVPEIDEDIRSA